jgi:hypothetical protein
MNEKIQFRKLRDIGEIISITFAFIRQNFSILALIVLYIGIPLCVLQGTLSMLYQQSLLNAQESNNALKVLSGVFNPYYFLNILLSVILYSVVSAGFYTYTLHYLQKSDFRRISIDEILRDTLKNLPMVLSTIFALGFFVFIIAIPSIFLIFLPVVYVAVSTLPLLFIRFYEKCDLFSAFSRSFKLVNRQWWKVFAVSLILFIIGFLISMVFSIPSSILSVITAFSSSSSSPSSLSSILFIIFLSLSALGAVFQTSISSIGIAFVYFDLVERQEAAGLFERVEQISNIDAKK